MSGLFSRFFKQKEPAPEPRGEGSLDAQIEALERQSKEALDGLKGTPLNTAGDLCLKAGDLPRAVRYFGKAIDAFLSDHQPEAARGVAKKIIRVHPAAVRTLCTLTWLDLAARHGADALVHLPTYVDAAIRESRQDLASEQVLAMAALSTDPDFLQAAADALDRLERGDEAVKVREWIMTGGGPQAPEDEGQIQELCLAAAIGSNQQRKAEGAVA